MQGLRKTRNPRILVAPLDWGLGHATRCIPVIYELISQNCDIWLAAEGNQAAILKQEFPTLPILPLPGYRVNYGGSAVTTLLNIIGQSARILRAIRHEHKWLKKIVNEYDFDAVLSDNRYGLYHSKIPCIFMTHQLTIKTPFGRWVEGGLQKRNYKYIDRFTECWVPDEEGENNLAGELSHPVRKPVIPVHYVSCLSRLTRVDEEVQKNHLLILLSGPEPQRTILENKIIDDIARFDGSATIARGLPDTKNLIPSTNTIKFYNHLGTDELSREMNMADLVVSRSGYSSVMDIVKLKKKSILIPTPGQPEQEYLADHLQERKIAFTISQRSFSLFLTLEQAGRFDYSFPFTYNPGSLKGVVSRFVSTLRQ